MKKYICGRVQSRKTLVNKSHARLSHEDERSEGRTADSYCCGRVQSRKTLVNKSHARLSREDERSEGRTADSYCYRIAAVIAIILIALLLLAARPAKHKVWKAYTVSSGDTLWTIARSEYGDSVDIRKKIAEICAENDIKPDKLTAGDVILIPMEAE